MVIDHSVLCLLPLSQIGLPCHVSDENTRASLLMYASYFALFSKFFCDNYVCPAPAMSFGEGIEQSFRVGVGLIVTF